MTWVLPCPVAREHPASAVKAQYKAKPFPGQKPYQQHAEKALPLLVRQAFTQEPIFYANLARELGMPNPRNLNYVLGSVGNALVELGKKWRQKVPPIQALVVNQKTGLPGSGGRWFVLGDRTLEPNAMRLAIRQSFGTIFQYPKWRDVLEHFRLKPIDNTYDALLRSAGTGGRGGGESAEHKALKEEVRANPRLAGIQFIQSGESEVDIPSGDALDVCFRTEDRFAAVEVKTRAASESDITRGLYQCVKYDAVIRKWLAFRRSNQAVSVVLLLESELPESLVPLRNALAVNIVELRRGG